MNKVGLSMGKQLNLLFMITETFHKLLLPKINFKLPPDRVSIN